MLTRVEKQQEAVRRMKESPCQCLEYHPMRGTTIYNEMLEEWKRWRTLSPHKTSVDKNWIFVHLMKSQNCPFIIEGKSGK